MRVLLTRPQEDALEVADALSARGHQALIAPIVSIVPLACDIELSAVDGIIFSSRHAIQRARDKLKAFPGDYYVVGDKTAETLMAEGGHARLIAADSESLMAMLKEQVPPNTSLLYCAAEEVAGGITLGSFGDGRSIQKCAVYSMVTAKHMPSALSDILLQNKAEVALFYSKRSAEAFKTLVVGAEMTNSIKAVTAISISENVARALDPLPFLDHKIAVEKTSQSMLEAINAIAGGE